MNTLTKYLGGRDRFCPARVNNLDEFKRLFSNPTLVGRVDDLYINGMEESIDDLLERVGEMENLRGLHVHSCPRFTGEGLRHLTGLKSLQALVILICPNYTGEGLQYLHGIAKMEYVKYSFKSNGLTDAGARAAFGFPTLEHVEFIQSLAMTGDRAFEGIGPLRELFGMEVAYCDNLRRVEMDGLGDHTFLFGIHSCPALEEIHFTNSPAMQEFHTEHPFSRRGGTPSLRLVTFDGVPQPIPE